VQVGWTVGVVEFQDLCLAPGRHRMQRERVRGRGREPLNVLAAVPLLGHGRVGEGWEEFGPGSVLLVERAGLILHVLRYGEQLSRCLPVGLGSSDPADELQSRRQRPVAVVVGGHLQRW
jgi:hypothetical protein